MSSMPFRDVPVGAIWSHTKNPSYYAYLKFREVPLEGPPVKCSVYVTRKEDEWCAPSYRVGTLESSLCWVHVPPHANELQYGPWKGCQELDLPVVLKELPDIPTFTE